MAGNAALLQDGTGAVVLADGALTGDVYNGGLRQRPDGSLVVAAGAGVTFANLPAASGVAGKIYRVTNVGLSGFGSLWVSNGTRWSLLGSEATIAVLGAVASGIANSETIIFQTGALPAGTIQTNDVIRVWIGLTKSGTTDSCSLQVRMGTAGTTADTSVLSMTAVGAANRTYGAILDFKLTAATSLQRIAAIITTGSYIGPSSSAFPSATTITDASANALYITVTLASSSTNDTVGASSGRIQLLTP